MQRGEVGNGLARAPEFQARRDLAEYWADFLEAKLPASMQTPRNYRQRTTREEIPPAQWPELRWLDDHLPKLDKKSPLVLFTHFPLG